MLSLSISALSLFTLSFSSTYRSQFMHHLAIEISLSRSQSLAHSLSLHFLNLLMSLYLSMSLSVFLSISLCLFVSPSLCMPVCLSAVVSRQNYVPRELFGILNYVCPKTYFVCDYVLLNVLQIRSSSAYFSPFINL